MKRTAAIAVVLACTAAAGAGVAWLALGGPAPARPAAEVANLHARRADKPVPSTEAPKLHAPRADSRAVSGSARADGEPTRRDEAASAQPRLAPRAPEADATFAAAGRDLGYGEIIEGLRAKEAGYEVLASRLDMGTRHVQPKWRGGDSWVVETYRRQMQASNEVWSGPALWRFEIAREVSFRDRECFEIVVRRDDGEIFPPTVFYVTREGYRLAGMETTVMQQGKKHKITHIPEGVDDWVAQGIDVLFTIVPFDLPPIGAEAVVVPDALGFDAALPPGAMPEGGRGRMPPPEEWLGAGRQYLDLVYASPIDGTTVRQRWSQDDMRWPVVSRTETTWSYRRRQE